ncbi:MAG: hypothetical protein ACXW6J_18135 [Candidatus Binatia bacterium]
MRTFLLKFTAKFQLTNRPFGILSEFCRRITHWRAFARIVALIGAARVQPFRQSNRCPIRHELLANAPIAETSAKEFSRENRRTITIQG